MLDKKSIVTVLVVLIIMTSLASVIIVSELKGEKDTTSSGAYQVISRVNNEGSGIYIDKNTLGGHPEKFYNEDPETGIISFSEENAAAWNKLIVGTPGAATIQHVYMQQIVESMGMVFTLYQDGQVLEDNHVYFITGMNNAGVVLKNEFLKAGMLWEPQFSQIVEDESGRFVELALTNDIYPGHTCCILVGSMNYMRQNSEITERFLVGYMKGVDYINDALNGDEDKYQEVLRIAKEKTGITDEQILNDALSNITYTDKDTDQGSLENLKEDIASLTDSLEASGLVTHKISEMGYRYSAQFANDFVDDAYIKTAVTKTPQDYSKSSRASVKVACISGDIHQLALHVAVDRGFFDDVKLNISVLTAESGPKVAVALQNNTAQFGLLGAPPATSTVINGMLIHA